MPTEIPGRISGKTFSLWSAGVVAACLMVPALVPALADEPMPDSNGGRYTFSKVTDGVLRLDTQTGEVAACSARAVGWARLAAPEDRAALENEIVRLRRENAALKQDILSRGLPLPPGAMPEPPAARDGTAAHDNAAHDNDITIRLPDNADIDRAVAYMGQMWQRFVDAVVKAQKQILNKS